MLAYQNHSEIKYSSYLLEQFSYLLRFVNPEYYLKNTNIVYYLVPIFTFICLMHMVFILVTYLNYREQIKNTSKNQNYHKDRKQFLVHLLFICITTIFVIPIIQSSIVSIYCSPNSKYSQNMDCYTSSNLVLMFLGVINAIWLILSNLYFSLFYFIGNPFSTSFLAISSNIWNLGKFLVKITPFIYLQIDV